MTVWQGLTWDHPRGRCALEAAATRFAAESGERIRWDAQPLEGFESHPVAELADRYDLIVLDHPHLGDAVDAHCLRPLDEVFGAAELDAWDEASVGPSFASYRLGGHVWALPLDAATQVSVRRADLVPDAPETWAEVEVLAEKAPVALSLAGPHAFLTWCSILVAHGAAPVEVDGGLVVDPDAALSALSLMARIAGRAPAATDLLNPIGMLHAMRTTDRIAYVPLIYGYVTDAAALAFGDAPASEPGGRRGSTIGGTGLAISRRCAPSPALRDHIAWLMSDAAQCRFIPEHAGQPSARRAWTDDRVNAAASGFYRSTLATIETSWVRPRGRGATIRQLEASAAIRRGLRNGDLRSVVDHLRAEEVRA